MTTVRDAIASGLIGGRLWLYSNYHCNLACSYCLTESSPSVPARALASGTMERLAEEAGALGFAGVGITGGEPFLVPEMPRLLARIAGWLPVLVLSNGTLFGGRRLRHVSDLSGLPVSIQISLDRSEPVANDAMRGPENFARVVEAIPKLVALGINVRIASTLEPDDRDDLAELCSLHRALGVADEDHVIRSIVRRGRAKHGAMGAVVGPSDLFPELTVSADGAFWSPFGATVSDGRADTDLLVTRTTRPLERAAAAMVALAERTGSIPASEAGFT